MSRLKKEQALKKLKNTLSIADSESFLQMIWAIDRLQSDPPLNVSRIFTYPIEARTVDPADKFFAHKWKLEELINVKLVTAMKVRRHTGRTMHLDCSQWSAFTRVFNHYHKYQGELEALTLNDANVFRLLSRIAHKQFGWQRGVLNKPNLYRSGYLYGGKVANRYLLQKYDITHNQFSLCGFALAAKFTKQPYIDLACNFDAIGIGPEVLQKVLNRVSCDYLDLKKIALMRRQGNVYDPYAASALHAYPCISFDNSRLRCPMVELLTERTTKGIYYDVVGGPTKVLNEIGAKFESYSVEFLQTTFSEFGTFPEIEYGKKGRKRKSPDILIKQKDDIKLLIECKATRMSFEAKFDLKSLPAEAGKISEIAKGVFQIWRFCSDIRLGRVPGNNFIESPLGMVLTLDKWNQMTIGRYEEIVDLADKLAQKNSDIKEVDKISVSICDIDDFEDLCLNATAKTFLKTIQSATAVENKNWDLSMLHAKQYPEMSNVKEYPFLERLGEVLPWWNDIEDEKT